MGLSNDNYYGYIPWLLATHQVTWLECAAASLCWSTILVYYLEEPYGHLMLEDVRGASARTVVRGNLLSFAPQGFGFKVAQLSVIVHPRLS